MNVVSEINRHGTVVYVKPTNTIKFKVCFCSVRDFFCYPWRKQKILTSRSLKTA